MKKNKGMIQLCVIGFLLGITAFVALLWLERQSLKDLEQKIVVRCIQSCPIGEEITAENVAEYFEVTEVPAVLATEQTVTELQQLCGTYPERTVEAGEIIYRSVFATEDKAEELGNPVEISVTAGIEYAVAGRIRKGDIVNVYVKNRDTEDYELILENVLVRAAYDSNATVISMGNEHALASMFTFYVEAEVAEELGKLYSGNTAVLKVR